MPGSVGPAHLLHLPAERVLPPTAGKSGSENGPWNYRMIKTDCLKKEKEKKRQEKKQKEKTNEPEQNPCEFIGAFE